MQVTGLEPHVTLDCRYQSLLHCFFDDQVLVERLKRPLEILLHISFDMFLHKVSRCFGFENFTRYGQVLKSRGGSPLKKTLVFHIKFIFAAFSVVNTTYYIETIDFRVREKILKHQHGESPYNVELFLIFARNTSTVRTNLTNKRSAQNAGNDISGLQISDIFHGENAP